MFKPVALLSLLCPIVCLSARVTSYVSVSCLYRKDAGFFTLKGYVNGTLIDEYKYVARGKSKHFVRVTDPSVVEHYHPRKLFYAASVEPGFSSLTLYRMSVQLTLNYTDKLYPYKFDLTFKTCYAEHNNKTVAEHHMSLNLTYALHDYARAVYSSVHETAGYKMPNDTHGEVVVTTDGQSYLCEETSLFPAPEAVRDLEQENYLNTGTFVYVDDRGRYTTARFYMSLGDNVTYRRQAEIGANVCFVDPSDLKNKKHYGNETEDFSYYPLILDTEYDVGCEGSECIFTPSELPPERGRGTVLAVCVALSVFILTAGLVALVFRFRRFLPEPLYLLCEHLAYTPLYAPVRV